MALQASDIIAAVACTSGYLSILDDEGYTPVPIMEIHGFIDENQQYSNNVGWGILDEERRNLESMQSGAIENLYDWAEFNECQGATPDRNQPGAIYSIQGFTNCAEGTEVALITVHGGGHNLYVNDVCTPDIIWNCFGNQGLYDTNQLEWDFLSRFSKEVESN
jgi:poly(3-hydroxybutyrate) depolymerase